MNEQEIILMAKGHIRLGNYAKARVLLEEVSTNKVAVTLLRKLDTHEARQKAKLGQGGGMSPTIIEKRGEEIPRFALIIIIGSMSLWGLMILLTAASTSSLGELALYAGVLVLIFGFIFAIYYLGWKFYWWMIALGWMLSSCFLITALLSGIRSFADIALLTGR